MITLATLGDALAVCLLDLRGFSSKDFAKFHPGGSLGKKLYLRVSDLTKLNKKPEVQLDTDIKKVIIEISESMLGVTAVVNNNRVVGIITDGDLRRMLTQKAEVAHLLAKDIMSENPKTIDANELAVNALTLMREKSITQLMVLANDKYVGVIHLHDLIREGLV